MNSLFLVVLFVNANYICTAKTFIVGNFITYYILFNPILAGILENQDTLRGGEGEMFLGKSSNIVKMFAKK